MVFAGLVALIANLALVRSGSETVTMLVARDDIAIGSTVGPEMLRSVEVRVDDHVLTTLVRPEAVRAGFLGGRVTATPVAAGSPLRLTDLRPAATEEPGWRRIAIPLRKESAVGGAIAVDDRVDVIQVIDGTPRYVVADARVLAVPEPTGTALGATSGFYVTIGVDAATALCLSAAIESGGLTMVLSTGQPPVATEPCVIETSDPETAAVGDRPPPGADRPDPRVGDDGPAENGPARRAAGE